MAKKETQAKVDAPKAQDPKLELMGKSKEELVDLVLKYEATLRIAQQEINRSNEVILKLAKSSI